MAWGHDASHTRAWMAHSVQSLIIPSGALDNHAGELVIATVAAALPSCTQLHIDGAQDASRVSELMQRLGGRLVFLRSSTPSLLRLPYVIHACTSLKSLCNFDRH